jgi:hypothetical protein
VANTSSVATHDELVARVDADIDDLAAVLWLVDDDELSDRLWAQLVDLLVEGMLLDLRGEVLEGRCDRTTYAHQLIDLTDRCRRAGLLPLGRRRR